MTGEQADHSEVAEEQPEPRGGEMGQPIEEAGLEDGRQDVEEEEPEGETPGQKRRMAESRDQTGGENLPIMDYRVYHYLTTRKFPVGVIKPSLRASIRNSAQRFRLNFGVVYLVSKSGRQRRVATPADMQMIKDTCHGQGHPGMTNTWRRVSRTYWWQGMEQDCYDMVRACESCQKGKHKTVREDRMLKSVSVQGLQPFQKIAIDLAGPLPETALGNKYLIVMADYLSKWVEAVPAKDDKATTVANVFLNEIVSRYGSPLEVVSDNGKSFLTTFEQEIGRWGIKSLKIAPYNPKANGLVERAIQTVKGALSRSTGHAPHMWDQHLGMVLLAYRNGKQGSTKYSPHYLVFGREAVLPEQVAEVSAKFVMGEQGGVEEYAQQLAVVSQELSHSLSHAQLNVEESQARQRKDFEERKKTQASLIQQVKALPIGARVLVRTPDSQMVGLQHTWSGPFEFKGFTTEHRRTAVVRCLETGKELRRPTSFLKPFVESFVFCVGAGGETGVLREKRGGKKSGKVKGKEL
jgi:hypothetical protein